MKINEIRAIAPAELPLKVIEARRELIGMRMKAKQGAIEQPHRIRQARREIARMLTVLRKG